MVHEKNGVYLSTYVVYSSVIVLTTSSDKTTEKYTFPKSVKLNYLPADKLPSSAELGTVLFFSSSHTSLLWLSLLEVLASVSLPMVVSVPPTVSARSVASLLLAGNS